MEYRLTGRGKFVLSLFILILVVNIYISGRYILNYFSNSNHDKVSVVSTTEQSSEILTEASEDTIEQIVTTEHISTTEQVTSTEHVETTEDVEKIYSVNELDDLRRYKMIIYFESDRATIELSSSDMDSLKSMIHQYPDEKIAIAGHVNGYPNYVKSEEALELSLMRANFIKDLFVDLGIEESMISVYNFGLEKPLYKDYGNQDKNDRVEIYFEDHFVTGEGGK